MDVHSKVMGSSFIPDVEKTLKTLVVGQELNLVREPTNDYDKHAIQVLAGNDRIGFLAAHVAREFAPRIDNDGVKFYCYVADITGGTEDKPNYGVNLRLTDFDIHQQGDSGEQIDNSIMNEI